MDTLYFAIFLLNAADQVYVSIARLNQCRADRESDMEQTRNWFTRNPIRDIANCSYPFPDLAGPALHALIVFSASWRLRMISLDGQVY